MAKEYKEVLNKYKLFKTMCQLSITQLDHVILMATQYGSS